MATPEQRTTAARHGRQPQRLCVGCRRRLDQRAMVRCTIADVVPSIWRNAPGRGAWVCSLECFDTAVDRRAFDRAWKQTVPAGTLSTLRITFEAEIADMKESLSVGSRSDNAVPTKG